MTWSTMEIHRFNLGARVSQSAAVHSDMTTGSFNFKYYKGFELIGVAV